MFRGAMATALCRMISAMDRADGFKNYFISGSATGITHTELASDARTIALITAILDGKAFAAPAGFATSSRICFSGAAQETGGGTVLEFGAHGADGLTVQDGAGRATGVDASGTVELGIPASTYDAIGDNYFITVPDGGDYHLVTNASSSHDLIVTAKGYDGGSETESATYVVPMASSSPAGGGGPIGTTTAELSITDPASAGDLTVTVGANTGSPTGTGQMASTTFSVPPTVEMALHPWISRLLL